MVSIKPLVSRQKRKTKFKKKSSKTSPDHSKISLQLIYQKTFPYKACEFC